MNFFSKYRQDFIIFALIAILYFILRLPNLTLQPIFADEAIYIRWAQVMKAEPTLRFVSLSDGKTPLFMWSMIPLFKIIPDPLLAGRFLSVLSGLTTLTGVFLLTRKIFGRNAGFFSAFLYVITPYAVFFDRMALVDSMLSAFTVWVIYFAVWLQQSLRLDLAMILGYLMGGALLVKTPAMVNILILPLSLIGVIKKGYQRSRLLKLLLYWGVAIVIAMVIYNMLRLGPGFHQLSSRNADYMFSLSELKGRPLDPFIPHMGDINDWFPKLFSIPILVAVCVGIIMSILSLSRQGLIVLTWALVPLLLEMAFLKTFTARYLLPSVAPLLIFGGFGVAHIMQKVRVKNYLKVLISILILSPLALKFDYQLITNPPPADLPKAEKRGYFEDWTAGYGLKEMAEYIVKQGNGKRVVLGTEGFFGTLPDGVQIYLDKENVAIVGSTATISAQVRNAAKDQLTFYIGNKKNTEGSVSNVKLLKEYPKSRSEDGSRDAMVLYRVFPQ